MEKMLSLIVSFLLVIGHHLAEGCSCMPAHPQTHYCQAAYAIKAVILSQESELDYGRVRSITYQAQVEEVFKSNNDDIKPGATVAIKTAGDGAMCGKSLSDGETYFISGVSWDGVLRVDLCDWAERWSTVSASQKSALRYFYKLTCNECEVKSTYSYGRQSSSSGISSCTTKLTWYKNSCEEKYSTCMQVTAGTCEWLMTSPYTDCVNKRDGERGSGYPTW